MMPGTHGILQIVAHTIQLSAELPQTDLVPARLERSGR